MATGFFFLTLMGELVAQQRMISSRDTSVRLQSDDPIAAALDSLAYLRLFESTRLGGEVVHPGTLGFPADSVPVYDASVMAQRIARLDAQSPMKLVYNEEVRAYINMYAIRKRELVSRMIGLSELYFPLFEEALARHKIPMELKYLAIVESALNPAARSRAGAQGLWQFMYGTGKLFGLKTNSYIDERCDPRKATEAACLYLKYLYSIYKDWSLVLAAYNSGPGNVNKAIRRSGGKTNYWELRPYLPRETGGYVPAFIAATYVMSYAKEHNLHRTMPRAIFNDIDTLHIKRRITFEQLSTVLDMPLEDIQFLNPVYLLDVIPESETYNVLTLPKSKIPAFINNEETIYSYRSSGTRTDSLMNIRNALPQSKIHVVRSGESISTVARKYGVSVNDLRKWNKLPSSKLQRGQRLNVTAPYSTKVQDVVSSSGQNNNPPPPVPGSRQQGDEKTFAYYKVRPGDTLWKIATSHGMTLEEIKKLNGFTSNTVLKAGMQVKVKPKN